MSTNSPFASLVVSLSPAAGLARLVQTYMEPSLEQSPAQVLVLEDGQLLVLGVAEQQQWVAEFLRLQREEWGYFLLKMTLRTVPAGSLRELFTQAGTGALVSTEVSAEQLGERAQAAGGELVSSPTLLVEPRQRASLAITSQRSFVVDWVLHKVEPDMSLVADPQIEVVDEGIVVEARAVPLPGARIGLELAFARAEIEDPVPQERVSLADGLPEVEVSLVTQRRTSARTHLVLFGEHANLLVPDGADGQDVVVGLVVERMHADRAAELAESMPIEAPASGDEQHER